MAQSTAKDDQGLGSPRDISNYCRLPTFFCTDEEGPAVNPTSNSTHHSNPTTSSTSSFYDLQNPAHWDHNTAQLLHEYDFGFDVNAQSSVSSTADSLFPLDAFTLPVSQAPFQNSSDWWLPQTDSSCELLSWDNPLIEEDFSLESSFPIAAGTLLGNDNFLGQSDVGSIDNMPQSHSFLDNQTHRAISTDQSSPPSPQPKSTTSQTHSSPPSSPSPKIQTPTSSSTTMSRVDKRKLNTMAARRYRQKRVDQMSSLEAAMKEVERERDALKVRVAKLEGETDILKSLLSKKD
ncbi:hypothetical protein SBOR_6784 [Sclerotinia borealis F-4128]|uniref:BZIP domain-containing protein n=1 Tax=Sclerotinia borealis (strain F-4128) TaxID=1432307 RepID=W9CE83_SCLBF|nr:hypothetical protein SBOR_6784 [Sclerotinia borealis F-4128]